MSTDIARRETQVQINAYERFTTEERALVHRTVAPNTTPEELLMFLSVCAQNNLDPFAREAWCIKMPGRNGQEGKLVMIVGKYGWLKVVERHPDYRGTQSAVVHKGDSFKKLAKPRRMPNGQYTWVEHEFDVTGDRGVLLGAYSETYREGRMPEFFFAKLDQYQPFSTKRLYDDQTEADFHGITVYLSKNDFFKPWWGTTDTMIEKCARTTNWRNAFPLGAIYGEEEMASAMAPTVDDVESDLAAAIEWGDDPAVAERMRGLFEAANEASPNAFPQAKIMLMLAGKSDEDRYALAAQELIPFIRDHGGVVPDPPAAGGSEVEAEDAEFEDLRPEGERSGEEQGEEPETLPGV